LHYYIQALLILPIMAEGRRKCLAISDSDDARPDRVQDHVPAQLQHDSKYNDVMQHPRGTYAGLAWHAFQKPGSWLFVNKETTSRPPLDVPAVRLLISLYGYRYIQPLCFSHPAL
jgi:hypothetical protein